MDKESAFNAGDSRFDPSQEDTLEPGESYGQRSPAVTYSPRSYKSDTTEATEHGLMIS